MDYSPKLKRVMEDIKAILKKEDIAGVVVIHEPGFSEHVTNVCPTYSAAVVEPGKIRFKTSSKHYSTKYERQNVVTNTVNMMHHLSKMTGQIAMGLLDASMMLDKATEAEHFSGGHTSHDQQNN